MIKKAQWMVWAAAMGGWFALYEVPAIRNAYDGDTLSEYVWSMGPWRFLIVGGLVWLTIHFIRAR